MRAIQNPSDYEDRAAPGITVHALNANKRPIGFARDWPQEPKKKRKKKRA